MIFLILILFVGVLYIISQSIYDIAFARKNGIALSDDISMALDMVNIEFEEPVEKFIRAADGTQLCAYFYLKNSRNIAIVIHGYGGSHNEMKYFAWQYYNKLNCSVCVPDLRAHGKSGGKCIGLSVTDSEDMILWINYIKGMLGENVNIIIHGISQGAATALMTAEKYSDNISCIISDSAFLSTEQIIKYRMKKELMLPGFPFINILNLIVKVRGGYSLYDGNILRGIKKISCPVLYIHGGEDDFVPYRWVYSLYESTIQEKEIFVCENATHALSAAVEPQKYMDKVTEFVKKHLSYSTDKPHMLF